jgi:hypothetical protein
MRGGVCVELLCLLRMLGLLWLWVSVVQLQLHGRRVVQLHGLIVLLLMLWRVVQLVWVDVWLVVGVCAGVATCPILS